MKSIKLGFRIEWRAGQGRVPYDEHENDVVVTVGKVDIARIPIEHKGGVYEDSHAQELIIEAVTPYIERMFAPLEKP